jgi:hypothetical protein
VINLQTELKNTQKQLGDVQTLISKSKEQFGVLNEKKEEFFFKMASVEKDTEAALSKLLFSTVVRDELSKAIGSSFLASVLIDTLFPGFTYVESSLLTYIKDSASASRGVKRKTMQAIMKGPAAIYSLYGVYSAISTTQGFSGMAAAATPVVKLGGKLMEKTGKAINNLSTLKILETGVIELTKETCDAEENESMIIDGGTSSSSSSSSSSSYSFLKDQTKIAAKNTTKMSLFCIGTCIIAVGGVMVMSADVVGTISMIYSRLSLFACIVTVIFGNLLSVLLLTGVGLGIAALIVAVVVTYWPKCKLPQYMCFFNQIKDTVMKIAGGAMLAWTVYYYGGWIITLIQNAKSSGLYGLLDASLE